jgi:membrane protease YdiL (CAAX protease family)
MPKTASRSEGFAMAVMVEGGLALAAVALAWLFRVPLGERIAPWGPPLAWAVARGLAVTVPMLVIFWWLMHWDRPLLRQLREQVQWLIGEMFPDAHIGQFALVALLAGVGEELLFRGVIQTLLVDWTNPVAGLLIASLVFGAAHALSKLYFLLATLIGVLFGWLVLHFNDLVAPMVAHSVYDFVALVYISGSRPGTGSGAVQ